MYRVKCVYKLNNCAFNTYRFFISCYRINEIKIKSLFFLILLRSHSAQTYNSLIVEVVCIYSLFLHFCLIILSSNFHKIEILKICHFKWKSRFFYYQMISSSYLRTQEAWIRNFSSTEIYSKFVIATLMEQKK